MKEALEIFGIVAAFALGLFFLVTGVVLGIEKFYAFREWLHWRRVAETELKEIADDTHGETRLRNP